MGPYGDPREQTQTQIRTRVIFLKITFYTEAYGPDIEQNP